MVSSCGVSGGDDGVILVCDGGGACGDEMVVGQLWSVIGGGVVSVEVVMVAIVRRVIVAEMVAPAVDRDGGRGRQPMLIL
nr:hypothetical protein [Tanacetum cinerariifolium]